MLLYDANCVVLPAGTYRQMLEYSVTLPTGTTPGKRWRTTRWLPRRAMPEGAVDPHEVWFMGEFYALPLDEALKHPGEVGIRWRRIYVLDQDATPEQFNTAIALMRLGAADFEQVVSGLSPGCTAEVCPAAALCSYCDKQSARNVRGRQYVSPADQAR